MVSARWGRHGESFPVLGTSHDRDHGQTEIDKVGKGCCGKHDE